MHSSSSGIARLPWTRRPVITDDPMRHSSGHAVAGCVLSGLPDQPCNRIRTVDRHPLASVGSLVIGLRRSLCPGLAPMPVLTGLHASPPAVMWSQSKERGG